MYVLALWERKAPAMASLDGLYFGERPTRNLTSPRVPLSGSGYLEPKFMSRTR